LCYRAARRPGSWTGPAAVRSTTVHTTQEITMKRNQLTLIGGVLLTAGMLACGAGSSGDDKASGGGDTPAGGDKKETVATIGKPARDGKFEFTVTKVDCSKTSIGPAALKQKAQGKWCLVTVKVQNIGKEAQLFDASSQKALDAKGITYDADGGAGVYANENAETFLNNINPGNTVTGVLPFDVPKTVTITTLELHDSAFSGGVKVKVG
jgi:Domain of unknown function (DUF4352)